MKKILSKILISAIIIITIFGVFGVGGVDVVSAQTTQSSSGTVEGLVNGMTCNPLSTDFGYGGGCLTMVSWYVFYIPSSAILSISGGIFNTLLTVSLSNKIINASFVNDAWNALRGVANLLFIFILVAVSISIMLDFGQFNPKTVIRDVVIIALFVNFSLFAARVVIDAGNITALGFYDAIAVKNNTEPISTYDKIIKEADKGINKLLIGVEEKDVSGNLVSAFNPARFIDVKTFKSWLDGGGTPVMMFFVIIIAGLINLYMAYIFFSGGFFFIERIAWLWILMATAPLAFIAYIIPSLRSHWDKWWKKLIDFSFCIVVFLFWIWVTLLIVGNNFFKDLFDPTIKMGLLNLMIVLILQFMIVITLLSNSLKYTKKLCGDSTIGEKAFGMVKTAASFAIPSVAGAKTGAAALKAAGGIFARQTVGVGAGAVASGLEKAGVGTGRIGRTLLQSTRAIEGARFGTQESRKERVERQAKKQSDYMKSLPKEIKNKEGDVIKEPQEEFRKNIAGRTLFIPGLSTSSPIAWAVRGGDKKFVDDYKNKKDTEIKIKEKTDNELRIAQGDLEKAKDNLKMIKDSGATPQQIDTERDNVFKAQQKADKIKEEIKKLKEK